jgi:hypothetical protein
MEVFYRKHSGLAFSLSDWSLQRRLAGAPRTQKVTVLVQSLPFNQHLLVGFTI